MASYASPNTNPFAARKQQTGQLTCGVTVSYGEISAFVFLFHALGEIVDPQARPLILLVNVNILTLIL